jgi:hypothetical protein
LNPEPTEVVVAARGVVPGMEVRVGGAWKRVAEVESGEGVRRLRLLIGMFRPEPVWFSYLPGAALTVRHVLPKARAEAA